MANFCAIIFTVLVCTLWAVQSMPQSNIGLITTTEEPSVWDKIKKGAEHGWKVVYDESHCAFHKVKELVNPHDHQEGSDPCENKPYQQTTTTTPKSIVLVAEDFVPLPTTSG